MRLTATSILASAALLGLTACSSADGAQGDVPEIVTAGKADNYYSNMANEYEITGTVSVAMTEAEFKDERVRDEKVNARLTAVGLYLTAYLTDKFESIDKNGDGTITDDEIFFRNVGYGGFYAMVRNYSVAATELGVSADGYDVTFSIDVGGPRDLLTRLPKSENVEAPAGIVGFELRMPAGKSVDTDAVPRTEIRNFNADTYTGELETHGLVASTLPTPGNAYPHFDEFFADGVLDVTMFYGYDYNKDRSDLSGIADAFEALTQEYEFTAPAASAEELTADSGPFTKDVTVNGKSARIEVRLFAEPMFIGDRKGQHDRALSEITSRDVFFYNGHAGPYYGFYLDADKAAQVNYDEFRDAPFTDKQQLVIAQGCQTYSQYADMLYANDAKDESNLDVITTVNYSYGIGTTELLGNIIGTDGAGRHKPVDFYGIIADINSEYWNREKQVFYGVMGIDGNAQIHPYANLSSIGNACSQSSDCGDPAGNTCASFGGSRICAAVALGEGACPGGSTFGYVAAGGSLQTGACY